MSRNYNVFPTLWVFLPSEVEDPRLLVPASIYLSMLTFYLTDSDTQLSITLGYISPCDQCSIQIILCNASFETFITVELTNLHPPKKYIDEEILEPMANQCNMGHKPVAIVGLLESHLSKFKCYLDDFQHWFVNDLSMKNHHMINDTSRQPFYDSKEATAHRNTYKLLQCKYRVSLMSEAAEIER